MQPAHPRCVKQQIDSITSGVPVDVRDVAGRSFTDPDSLGAQHIVDVHEAVMGRHRQVFTCIWGQREERVMVRYAEGRTAPLQQISSILWRRFQT